MKKLIVNSVDYGIKDFNEGHFFISIGSVNEGLISRLLGYALGIAIIAIPISILIAYPHLLPYAIFGALIGSLI